MIQKTLTEFSLTGEKPSETSETLCPTCGRSDFKSKRGLRQHRSKAHGDSIQGDLVPCDWCGTEVRRMPSDLESSERVICSSECDVAFRRDMAGSDHPNYKREVVPCDWCGETLERCPSTIYDTNFCDRQCHGKWKSENVSGEDHHQWDRVEVQCEVCGEAEYRTPAYADRVNRYFCGNECRAAGISGQGAPQWRGGQSIYHAVLHNIRDESWKQTRSRIREKYGGQCISCGREEENIPIHHIVPVMAGGCNEDELLIPLCRNCHPKVESYMRELCPSVLTE